MGYWQSEKYFNDFEENIRSDFSFKAALDGENLETSVRMRGCNSVSLHVRRGDYVTHAPTAKILNACSIDYYYKAISRIGEKVPAPHFFVFSDDQQWVRNNLKVPFPAEYIDRNHGMQSYIDMQSPAVIVKILTHLGLPARAPPRAPARRLDLFEAA